MAESFNVSIIEIRFKPIYTMPDIFKSIMNRIAFRKQMAEHLQQEICPLVLKKLEKGKDYSRWWQATIAGHGLYSVDHGIEGFAVNILAKKCVCKA